VSAVSLWGSLCHHVEWGVSRFIPSILSDAAAGVTAKRFIAADWDRSLPAARAAEKAGAPIAWLGIAQMPIEPT